MNKEEFLKKMREENEGNDPFENETSLLGWKIGAIVALALSFIISFLEWFLYGEHNFAMFVAILPMLVIHFIIKAIKLKHLFDIVYSIILSILLIVFISTYIFALVNGWL